jgi:CubicO group peptidase (beta-lactamase class C family)
MTWGWLCGALIRRVDGRTVGRFLAEEVASPLGLEVWIGLPPHHERRVAVIERGDGFEAKSSGLPGDTDRIAWSIWGNPPRFTGPELAANLPSWHAAEVPASNGIVSARSLARLYGCLARGGEIDGVKLVSEETVAAARQCLSRGYDRYLEAPIAFGIGFQVQTADAPFGPPADAFGHAGAGGSIHGAWPGLRTGFSYTPNLLGRLGATDPRAESVLAALHVAVTLNQQPTADNPRP